ncbi:LuxR C-terminal-related transcriptional regulator [Streptomyces sp. NPDC059649]|uniref:LuxR family transcriptional regulator n=1 Tax=Streptomyces sp. NPDC059649 TaxID=3346895 RepID=UPI0036B84943
MAFAFEILSWVSERQARHVRAATLSGAAAAMWRTVGTSPDYFHPVGVVHQQDISMVRAAMGDDRYNTAFQRGHDLSEEAAVDYVLETATSTSQQRQANGEDSDLTPRERQIAKLVSEGLTNKEIAARLVIAPRTAEDTSNASWPSSGSAHVRKLPPGTSADRTFGNCPSPRTDCGVLPARPLPQ